MQTPNTQPRKFGIQWFTVSCVALSVACSDLPGGPAADDFETEGAGGANASLVGVGGGSNAGNGSGGGASVVNAGVGGAADVEMNPLPFAPAEGMLRRLTRPQFRNAVRDVFGFEVDIDALDADSHNGEFAVVGAASVVTSDVGVEQYGAAIEAAVESLFSDAARSSQFVGCEPVNAEDECVRAFIEREGQRSWRRPLEAAEVEQLVAVVKLAAVELGTAIEGVHWATVAMYSSVNFLYRPELGEAAPDGGLRLTSYEVASRLAFLTFNSLPDDQLLQDAAAGVLDSPEGIRSAAERLLGESAGREAVGAFAEDFMRLDRILSQAKDPALYPEYGPALQEGMVQDVRGVWEIIAFDDESSALDVFSTTKVVANLELANFYGLDSGGLSSDTFKAFSLPADGPRIGILGKPGFLSQFANQKEGSPTLRGKFMREAMMCEHIPPPPAGVALDLVESTSDDPKTKRQRLEQHRVNASCAGCHAMMDPMGLPFENFDAIGRYRTEDSGLPIDPSGDLDGVPVADARELGLAMSTSEAIASCLLRKYYSYAMGYQEREVDEVVIEELAASFETSGYRLKDLILEVVTSDAFVQVAPQSH